MASHFSAQIDTAILVADGDKSTEAPSFTDCKVILTGSAYFNMIIHVNVLSNGLQREKEECLPVASSCEHDNEP
jgi:hypothetical protein